MSLQSHAVQQKYALLHYLLSAGRDPQMRGHVAGAVRIVDRHPVPGHKYNRDVRELFNFFVQNKLKCEFGGKEWWLGLQNIDLMLEFLQRKSDPGYKYDGRENFIVSGREDQLTTSDLWISFASLSLDVQVRNLTEKTLVNRVITPTKTVPMDYKAITPKFGEPGIPSYRTPPEKRKRVSFSSSESE